MAKASAPPKMPEFPADLFNTAPMLAVSQRGMQAFADAQSQMMQQMVDMNSEFLRFVDQRLDRDRETAKALAACTSPQDAADICKDFFEGAMQEYSDEVQRLAGMVAEKTQDAMETAQTQVAETLTSTGKD